MLDFPNAPTLNQKFPAPPTAGLPVYTWDGEKWTTIAGSPGSVGGSSQVYIGDTAPVGVADNSLWWESDTGLLYVRFNDGNSTAWVQIAISPMMDYSTVVLKAGDTMTGLLTLSGDPATALQAVTKRYVDAAAVLVRNHIAGLTISMPGGTGAFSVASGTGEPTAPTSRCWRWPQRSAKPRRRGQSAMATARSMSEGSRRARSIMCS